MKDLQVFKKDNFQIRTINVKGEPYFVAKDIAEMLGYLESKDLTRRLDDDEKGVYKLPTLGGEQNLTIINESGLYNAILGSNKPEAKSFKKWITSEVLPSIRKNGIYATETTIDNMIANPDFAIKLLQNLKEEKNRRIQAEKTVTILSHVSKTYTATEIAKEAGMKSAQELNNFLSERKIQYFVNKTWVFYSEYANKGYADIKQEVLDNGKVVYHRRFTQIGREFILKLLEA